MSERTSRKKRRLVVTVRALLPEDWTGNAGSLFRRTMAAISDFVKGHNLTARELAEETVSLARVKVRGLANKEWATAEKEFAEAEQKRIEAELSKRSLESDVRKKEAEARAAEIAVLKAELEFLSMLKQGDVVLRCDSKGNLTVLPSTNDCNLQRFPDRLLSSDGNDDFEES